ncbi:hypothetical protein T10_9811 [Trichinella papuae]|uniref:Uncharacterized protein n=1 Tax=Trichinella papuae TaxID=268474 RepID=A0A0V1N6H7_9BILA|nr:hypothetical protein T10_9811 [Trichinella papuae]
MITECSLDFLPYPDPPGSDRHRQTLTQLVGRWAAQLTADGQQLIPLTDNNILAIVSISLWAREQADSRQEMNLVRSAAFRKVTCVQPGFDDVRSIGDVTGLLGLSSQHHFGQLSPIVRNIPRSMVVFQWFACFPLLDHRKQLTSCRRLYFVVWTFLITIAPVITVTIVLVNWLTIGFGLSAVYYKELGCSAYPMTNWKWTKDEKITCSRGRLPCGRVTTFSSVVLFNAYTSIYRRRTLKVFSFAIVC